MNRPSRSRAAAVCRPSWGSSVPAPAAGGSCGPSPATAACRGTPRALPGLDGPGRVPVHPGRACSLVAPHPVPRDQKERGVGDEVEQIIEPAMRIIAGPAVQLGLDTPVPCAPPRTRRASSSSVFTGDILLTFQYFCCRLAGPLRHVRGLSARSDYYETSVPPGGHRPATDLPAAGPGARRVGRPQVVPTFTTESIKELGARLYPGSLATATPQAFSLASPPDLKTGFGVGPAPAERAPRTADRPLSARFEPGGTLTGRQTAVPLVHLLRLCLPDPGRPTVPDPSRRCQGCSRRPRRSPVRLPPASPGSCDCPAVEVSHLHRTDSASWRTHRRARTGGEPRARPVTHGHYKGSPTWARAG